MALPSRTNAETLVGFLPRFTDPSRSFVKGWNRGHDPATGVNQWPFPDYDDDVVRFFGVIASSEWASRDYLTDRTNVLVANPDQLSESSVGEVCDVLTHCWRGERFCDGHHQTMLKAGVVQAALRRLDQLVGILSGDER